MNYYRHADQLVASALEEVLRGAAHHGLEGPLSDLSLEGLRAERPKAGHGADLTVNAALVLAPRLERPAVEIAASLKAALEECEALARVDVGGPGFLNLTFADGFWHGTLDALIAAGERDGTTVPSAFPAGQGTEKRPGESLHAARTRLTGETLSRLGAHANQPVPSMQEEGEVRAVGQEIYYDTACSLIGQAMVDVALQMSPPDSPLDFDLKSAADRSSSNPAFYIPYAYARACSVLARADREFPHPFPAVRPAEGTIFPGGATGAEMALIRTLCEWPQVLVRGAARGGPQVLIAYLHNVAGVFFDWWKDAKSATDRDFIRIDNKDVTCARLTLIRGFLIVVGTGLELLGVEPKEEMD